MSCKSGKSYKIQSGETLFVVAQKEWGDGNRWKEILKPDGTPFTDNEVAGLQVGQEICIPQKVEPKPEKNELDYGKKRVIGYYENWGQWRKGDYKFLPKDIDASLFTHINFAFGLFGFITKPFDFNNPHLTGDYQVKPIEANDISELYPQLQALKAANPNLRTLISLGGWSFNDPSDNDAESPIGVHTYKLFSEMISLGSRRQEFIQSMIDYVYTHRFNGIDLDWEYPGTTDRGGQASDFENYLLLLKELRAAIDRDPRGRLFLTVAAPAIVPSNTATNFSEATKYFRWWADCAQYLDWLNVMTYDYHGAFDNPKVTGVNAPLSKDSNSGGDLSAAKTIDAYLKAGISREKLVLGLATYGRSHVLSSPPADLVGLGQAFMDDTDGKSKGLATDTPGFQSYYEIANDIKSGVARRGWDERTSTPYAYNPNKGVWVSYDDEQSLRLKSQYAGKQNLGGIMFWAIGLDDFKSGFPLVRAASQALFDTIPDFDAIDDLPSEKGEAIITAGYNPSIAVNEDGVVVQAFVLREILYTQIGKHTDEGIVWATKQEVAKVTSAAALRPGTSVAINNKGYVVIAFLGDKADSDNQELLVRMGRVEGYTIAWLSSAAKYGVGVNPSIALSDDNTFFEVHQAGLNDSSHYLHYHTGTIENGQLKVSPSSDRYDDGKQPAIAVMTLASGKNVLVEVHCSQSLSNRLWSRIGVVNGTEIQWGTSIRQEAEGIEDGGIRSSVAATKDGNVIEVHRSDENGSLWYKVGAFSEQDGRINWKHKAFKYDNGDEPSIALAGTKDNHILVETHAGDDGDIKIYSKASIPVTYRLVNAEMTFLEKVGIDLESHGVWLDEKTDQWERCELTVPESKIQQAWVIFQYGIMFVPFLPDLTSLTEHSIDCDRGDKDACKDIGIDLVFIALEVLPVGKAVKATAKSVMATLKSIAKVTAKVAKKIPLAEVIAVFRARKLGPVAEWFERHPDRLYEIIHSVEICKTSSKSLNISLISTSVAVPMALASSGCIPRSLVDSANRFGVSLSNAFKKYGKEPFLTFLKAAERLGIKSKRKFEMMIRELRNRFGKEAPIALKYPNGQQDDAITIADNSKQCIYTIEPRATRQNQLKYAYESGKPQPSPDGKFSVQNYSFSDKVIANAKDAGLALPWAPDRFTSVDLSALSRSGRREVVTGEVTTCGVGFSKDGNGKVWMHHCNCTKAQEDAVETALKAGDTMDAALKKGEIARLKEIKSQIGSLGHKTDNVFTGEDFLDDGGKAPYFFRAEENEDSWNLYVEYQNTQGAVVEKSLATYSNPS